jgi:hypothetical protein
MFGKKFQNLQTLLVLLIPNCTRHRMITYTNSSASYSRCTENRFPHVLNFFLVLLFFVVEKLTLQSLLSECSASLYLIWNENECNWGGGGGGGWCNTGRFAVDFQVNSGNSQGIKK